MKNTILRRAAHVLSALPLLLACASGRVGSVALAAGPDPCVAGDTSAKAANAQSLVQQKKYAEAEGPAREALGACPSEPTAAAALGAALVAQNKLDDAVDRMTAVISAKQDVAYAYLWRGQAYYRKKQPDKMVNDFQTFLKLAPNAPEAATVQQLLASLKK